MFLCVSCQFACELRDKVSCVRVCVSVLSGPGPVCSQGVGGSRSLLPASLFEHFPMCQAYNPSEHKNTRYDMLACLLCQVRALTLP